MLPEQRKRTGMTSPPVFHVIREKRPQFRLERRLLVPAYGLADNELSVWVWGSGIRRFFGSETEAGAEGDPVPLEVEGEPLE